MPLLAAGSVTVPLASVTPGSAKSGVPVDPSDADAGASLTLWTISRRSPPDSRTQAISAELPVSIIAKRLPASAACCRRRAISDR